MEMKKGETNLKFEGESLRNSESSSGSSSSSSSDSHESHIVIKKSIIYTEATICTENIIHMYPKASTPRIQLVVQVPVLTNRIVMTKTTIHTVIHQVAWAPTSARILIPVQDLIPTQVRTLVIMKIIPIIFLQSISVVITLLRLW
jgi:hypothetical protein